MCWFPLLASLTCPSPTLHPCHYSWPVSCTLDAANGPVHAKVSPHLPFMVFLNQILPSLHAGKHSHRRCRPAPPSSSPLPHVAPPGGSITFSLVSPVLTPSTTSLMLDDAILVSGPPPPPHDCGHGPGLLLVLHIIHVSTLFAGDPRQPIGIDMASRMSFLGHKTIPHRWRMLIKGNNEVNQGEKVYHNYRSN